MNSCVVLLAALAAIAQLRVTTAQGIDCATTLCPDPVCEGLPGYEAVSVLGKCCQTCRRAIPECSAVRCTSSFSCEEGFEPVPEGECCGRCERRGCAAVTCLALSELECERGQEPVVPDGECCPVCLPTRPDCSGVLCPVPDCEKGFGRVVPERECCPDCENCSVVECPARVPQCAAGYELVTDGTCCPECRPVDPCRGVTCDIPDCDGKELKLTFPKDACCPICQNCSAVSCPLPLCIPGYELVTPKDQCCPECQRRKGCAAVTCLALSELECEGGQEPVVPDGECCPVCLPTRPDCSGVLCPVPDCEKGFGRVVPERECCPDCENCSVVECPARVPQCAAGYELVTDGTCCPECRPVDPCRGVTCDIPDCDGKELKLTFPKDACCPICQNCSAVTCPLLFCKPGFELVTPKDQCCPECQPDPCAFVDCKPIECEEGVAIIVPAGECCPTCQISCPKGSHITLCEPCQDTCTLVATGEVRVCLEICRIGRYCACNTDRVVDERTGECALPEDCPSINTTSPCAAMPCPRGAVCKIHKPTGEAFCEPSCDITNGGCSLDEKCRQIDVDCKKAPCPPVVECVSLDVSNPCAVILCSTGQFCIVDEETGEGFCQASCEINNGGCPEDQECTLTPVQCLVPPCPVLVQCIGTGPCANFSCDPGSQCQVFGQTGEPYCEPSCSIDNGGCDKDEECLLLYLDCARAPCVPVVECIDPCSTMRCPRGSVCRVFDGRPTFSLEPYCEFSCDLDNGGCREDQVCRLQTVFCFRAPCPPHRLCLDPAEICNVDVDHGPCSRGERAFFFNRETGGCERFTYGGCGGNQNRFSTITECREACNLCLLPPETGPCRASVPSLFFNSTSEQCESFVYGGCRGNANRFSSVTDCEGACGGGDCPPTCSKQFCDHNRRAVCSNPGPRQLPGCTGPCQLTYCSACYYSAETLPTPDVEQDLPQRCRGITDYSENERCLFLWANEVRRAHRRAQGPPPNKDPLLFKCYNPDCPRRG